MLEGARKSFCISAGYRILPLRGLLPGLTGGRVIFGSHWTPELTGAGYEIDGA